MLLPATCSTGNLVQGEGKKLLRCVSANARAAPCNKGTCCSLSFGNIKIRRNWKRLGDVIGCVPINGPGIRAPCYCFKKKGPMLQVGGGESLHRSALDGGGHRPAPADADVGHDESPEFQGWKFFLWS